MDKIYMSRCIELARRGKGNTAPNPMVGSVIVHGDRIIGEGFHRKAGEPHAEVNAISSVKDQSLLSSSTLYVNLEPCSHYGKTPPCAELIIQKRIPRVVIGCLDPFPEVSGRGVRRLLEAGVEVVTGVLEKEAWELNKIFMTFQEKQRPYVFLKWAQSADGYIDRLRTDSSVPPVHLSSPETRRVTHKLRSEVSAILVGTHTAMLDNPSLTVRDWSGNPPVRLVLDKYLRLPSHYHLFDGSVPTLVFTSRPAQNQANIEYIILDFTQPVLPQIIGVLYQRKLNSLLVEGGSNLLKQFIEEDLWDEAHIETAPVNLGEGIIAPNLHAGNSPVVLRSGFSISENKGLRTRMVYTP